MNWKGINPLVDNRKYTQSELIQGIKNKDSRILEKIYQDNYRPIRHMIITNNGSSPDADDIFQETMVVLYRKIRDDEFKLTSTLNTYLYAIARLLWLKELDKKKRKKTEIKEFTDLDEYEQNTLLDDIEHNERQKLFRKVFKELSDDCKRVLRLFLNGIAIAEVTKIMGYSSDQHTKNRRFRCKKSLITKIRETKEFKELGHGKNKNNRDIPRW